MFRRKKQVAPQTKPPPPLPPPPTRAAHRKSIAKLTISDCLQQAQGALQKLRTINPGDLQAFPLLNEVQRLIQQLKEATASLPPADREAWSFQIADLEEEFRELADVVVSRADAAPKPEPRLAAPSTSSNSGAVSRSSMTSTLLSTSNSGRVQQAVALFSRQDGFTANNQGSGVRRVHTTYQHQRPQQPQALQQQQPQQLHHQHQQHEQYLEQRIVEHVHPQAASSVASTPARSDSFMYLTNEERELLAQKQQALLQRHFQYLAQQREAEEQGQDAASGRLVASAQPTGAAGVLPQQRGVLGQQHTQASMQALYHTQQRRGPPSDYGSTQATPHAGFMEPGQSPTWSSTIAQGSTSNAQGLASSGYAAYAPEAPWPSGAAGYNANATAVPTKDQQQQALYPSARPRMGLVHQQPAARLGGLAEGGAREDDLFSGLDIVATDEQPSLPKPSQQQEVPAQAAAMGAAGSNAATNACVNAGGTVTQSDATAQQHASAYSSFRQGAHSMPHRLHAGSQIGSRPGSAASSQQEAAAGARGLQPVQPAPGSNCETRISDAYQPQQTILLQNPQQPQGAIAQMQFMHYSAQQGAQQLESQRQDHLPQHMVLQQQYLGMRQHSASAQGYYQTHPDADTGATNAAGLLASPSGLRIPGTVAFSQVPGPAAGSTFVASDVSSSPYPLRKKTSLVKLGYGIEDLSSQEQTTQQQQSMVVTAAAAPSAGPQMLTGNVGVEPLGNAGAVGRAGSTAVGSQQQPAPADRSLQQDGLAMHHQGTWSHLQLQQQQTSQPNSPAYATFAAVSNQGMAVPEGPQQQQTLPDQHQPIQQRQQQYVQQPHSPQRHFDVDSARYPHVMPEGDVHELPQQPMQQQLPNVYAAPDPDLGRYPGVWPGDSATYNPPHLQQPKDPRHVQSQYPQQQTQQHLDQHHQCLQLEAQPMQHVHQHGEQNIHQHHLLQGQMPPAPRPDVGEQQVFATQLLQTPVTALSAASLPPEARPEGPCPPSSGLPAEESSFGYRNANGVVIGGAGRPSLQPQQPAVQSAAAAMPFGVTTRWPAQPSNGPQSIGSAAVAIAGLKSSASGSDPVVDKPALAQVPAPLASAVDTGGASTVATATPAATVPATRPSPYISAFLQHAQSAMDRGIALPGGTTPRPATAAATTPHLSSSLPAAAAAAPQALTPPSSAAPIPASIRVATTVAASTPQAQPSTAADINTPPFTLSPAAAATVASVPSLPLISATLRSRSRGIVSGGGAGSGNINGLGADLAASLPVPSSLPNLIDLEAFLDNITGPVDACRAAAEHRAREAISALAAALSQAQKVEATVQQQRRVVKAGLAGVLASVAHLESDQATAVENEDFDAAAALDEQLVQLTYRRASMDEQVRMLAEALLRAAALRLEVLSRQAEVWRITGAYLARLQSGQQEMAATLASQAEREAQAAAMLHRAAQEALEKRRGAVLERNAELEAAYKALEAQVAAVTAPAEAERQRRASAREALKTDVESLRALLAAKEAALASAEAAVAEAAEVVLQQTVAFDPELARLQEARTQLEVEAAQVASHEQALQESERQAKARAGAVEEHQLQLKLQADALGTAAAAMRSDADALMQRVATEAHCQEQRDRLLQADERAREDLKGLERCISDLSVDLSRIAEQRGKMAAERAAAQESLGGLQRFLPELEAAKRAAAASKDFREAARLSGEIRALTAQADMAAAQLARVSGALSELSAVESSKLSELEDLRAMVHDAQRHAAEAHHRYLAFSLGLNRAALEEAVGAELYEEAGALQAELTAEETEALALERTWGFVRPQQSGQAAAAAARRRSSLEAAASATQVSLHSLGSMSMQSSRSLSSQLPAAAVAAAVATAGLRLFPTVGGTATLSQTGGTGPTSAQALQQSLQQSQPQSQPQPLRQQQHVTNQYHLQVADQQSLTSPISNNPWTKRDSADVRGVDEVNNNSVRRSGHVATNASSPSHPVPIVPVSPVVYLLPQPVSLALMAPQPVAVPSTSSLYGAAPTDDRRVVTTGASPVNDSVLAAGLASSTPSRNSIEDESLAMHAVPHSPQLPVYVPPSQVVAASPPEGAVEGDISHGLHHAALKNRTFASEASASSSSPSMATDTLHTTHELGGVTTAVGGGETATQEELNRESQARAFVLNATAKSAPATDLCGLRSRGDTPAIITSDASSPVVTIAGDTGGYAPGSQYVEEDGERRGGVKLLQDNPLYQHERDTSGHEQSTSAPSSSGPGAAELERSRPQPQRPDKADMQVSVEAVSVPAGPVKVYAAVQADAGLAPVVDRGPEVH